MPHELKAVPKPLASTTRDTDELRHEIERSREQLQRSALALKEEVAAKTDWREWVRENPVPFVIGAFALGLYLGTRK